MKLVSACRADIAQFNYKLPSQVSTSMRESLIQNLEQLNILLFGKKKKIHKRKLDMPLS